MSNTALLLITLRWQRKRCLPEVTLSSITIVKADDDVEGKVNYNPYGAYAVNLRFGNFKVGEVVSLKVSLLKDNTTLSTNVFVKERALVDDPKLAGSSTISSPFNLGTGLLEKWAWDRGAYAHGVTENFEPYIPNGVWVEVILGNRAYQFKFPIEKQLELPPQQNPKPEVAPEPDTEIEE